MLLSSTAETMLWTGRYLERAHSLARAVMASERAFLDLPERGPGDLRPMLRIVGGDPAAAATGTEVLRRLVLDAENPSSVSGAIARARENLRRARVATPPEVWTVVNALQLRLSGAELASMVGAFGALEEVVASCVRIEGELVAGMTRDAVYSFWRIGTYLERADMLLRITEALLSTLEPGDASRLFDDVRWMGLLRAVGAQAMYRRRHHTQVDLPTVLEFLVLDESFPRSLAHCFTAIEGELRQLPSKPPALAARHNSHQIVSGLAGASSGGLPGEVSRVLSALASLYVAIESSYFPAEVAPESQAAELSHREVTSQPHLPSRAERIGDVRKVLEVPPADG